jgi:mRNA interferase RelE/StbE
VDERPTYQIEAQPDLVKQMRGIPRQDQVRLSERIKGLSVDPRPAGAEKMSGVEGWRIRVGDYRVVYWIDDAAHVVTITRIGQRGSVYRRR